MSWRTVVVSQRCKLDLSMGYMVVRSEETQRVFIDEMAVLIIENPAVSMTGCLLAELTKQKVRIIFCDEKRLPYGEIQPYNGCVDCSLKIREQSAWTEIQKKTVWTEIVAEKIRNQALILDYFGLTGERDMLNGYLEQLEYADETNREGLSAKVYFNALFGTRFSRGQDNPINSALNYGYGIILSAFAREVTLNGYLSQMGIFHENRFNPYNLPCDLMEPFRILVDKEVVEMNITEFNTEIKRKLTQILNKTVSIAEREQTILNAIKIYTKSVFEAIDGKDVSLIKFYSI